MKIQRIIVQDSRKVCIVNSPLDPQVSMGDIHAQFKKDKIGYFSIEVDSVGVVMVTLTKAIE